MRKVTLATVAALWALLAVPAQAGSVDGAKAFVRGVASDVLDIVKGGGSTDAQQEALLGVVNRSVDIDFVAKFVLGRHWRSATDDQRQRYLVAYRPFLKKNYVSRLTRYSGQKFKVNGARQDSDGSYVVTMDIIDPNAANVAMLYRVVEQGGDYLISDIVVEGVSLLATQRSEFNSIAQSKGVDYLIQALEKQGAR